jgi:hypothetical protein
VVTTVDEAARLRATLLRISELCEDGASLDEIHAFAVAALEPPPVDRCRCPFCHVRFEWPGLLDTHVQFRHSTDPDDLVLAGDLGWTS